MNAKKAMALLLTAAMSLSVLAGCGSSDDAKASVNENSLDSKQETSGESSTAGENSTDENTGSEGITFPLAETMHFTGFAIMNGDYAISDNPAMQKVCFEFNL